MLSVYLGLFVFFQIGFLFYLFNKKLHTVDLLWGLAHGVVGLGAYFFIDKSWAGDELVFLGLILAWSFRLYVYLLVRNWGKPDDRRYLELASKWKGSIFLNAYFRIFLVQMILSGVTSLSIFQGLSSDYKGSFQLLFFVGFFVSIFGLFYETVADLQLYFFKKSNPGKRLYGVGLYKFSRHPNYFGEILFWWGVYAMALHIGAPWWVVVSPITINWLIVNFSGVPFHKKKSDDQNFNNYLNSTNAVIPNFFKG